MFLAAINLILVFGAYYMLPRFIGLLCSCCFGCINFAALITTAVFRFNTMGKLAALSLTRSQYDSNSVIYIDLGGRTYADDASAITALWVFQLLAYIVSCCISVYFNRPPNHEDVARMH